MKKFLRTLFIASIIMLTSTISFSKTNDCFEPVNRAIFSFNMGLDKVIFKPFAKGYSYLPDPMKTGVKNATNNVSYFIQIPNQFLVVSYRH